jgi:hypothetical protein
MMIDSNDSDDLGKLVYCQNCGAAYLPETEDCDYCVGASLGAPPLVDELGDLTGFLTFNDEKQAWKVENILTGDGIPTELWETEGGLNRIYPGLASYFNKITLKVPENCIKRAVDCLYQAGFDSKGYERRE